MHDTKVTTPIHIVLLITKNSFANGSRSNSKTTVNVDERLSWVNMVDFFMQKDAKFLTLAIRHSNLEKSKGSVQHTMDSFIKSIKTEINEEKRFSLSTYSYNSQDSSNCSRIRIRKIGNSKETKSELSLNLILFNDGKTEILHAIKKLVENNTPESTITEESFRAALPYKDLPDPDMIVTLGSDISLSNPFLWQSAYSELHSIQSQWEQIGTEEINNIFEIYESRRRRFGSISEETTQQS